MMVHISVQIFVNVSIYLCQFSLDLQVTGHSFGLILTLNGSNDMFLQLLVFWGFDDKGYHLHFEGMAA